MRIWRSSSRWWSQGDAPESFSSSVVVLLGWLYLCRLCLLHLNVEDHVDEVDTSTRCKVTLDSILFVGLHAIYEFWQDYWFEKWYDWAGWNLRASAESMTLSTSQCGFLDFIDQMSQFLWFIILVVWYLDRVEEVDFQGWFHWWSSLVFLNNLSDFVTHKQTGTC